MSWLTEHVASYTDLVTIGVALVVSIGLERVIRPRSRFVWPVLYSLAYTATLLTIHHTPVRYYLDDPPPLAAHP